MLLSRLAWLALLCAPLASIACGNDSTGITAAEIACPTPQTLTYANFGQALVFDKCLECHTTRERPFLDTLAKVRTNATNMIEYAVYNSTMPNDGDITNLVRTQLGQWLMCGAP
jgi:uncharacterized membrane protein